ncbi:hypothetical protein TrCOL_g5869 [Triparma columacea]|uniref:Uncharacterized protein n=1 Tax=Triparma columacea TaxID=722753 RepID=A0A9W7LF52_9STRA|nr:hypothetical protein TrCOL_g5869 [Triparma columacea]
MTSSRSILELWQERILSSVPPPVLDTPPPRSREKESKGSSLLEEIRSSRKEHAFTVTLDAEISPKVHSFDPPLRRRSLVAEVKAQLQSSDHELRERMLESGMRSALNEKLAKSVSIDTVLRGAQGSAPSPSSGESNKPKQPKPKRRPAPKPPPLDQRENEYLPDNWVEKVSTVERRSKAVTSTAR